jgi:hypothetical protein
VLQLQADMFLCFIKYRDMKEEGEVKVQLQRFLKSGRGLRPTSRAYHNKRQESILAGNRTVPYHAF